MPHAIDFLIHKWLVLHNLTLSSAKNDVSFRIETHAVDSIQFHNNLSRVRVRSYQKVILKLILIPVINEINPRIYFAESNVLRTVLCEAFRGRTRPCQRHANLFRSVRFAILCRRRRLQFEHGGARLQRYLVRNTMREEFPARPIGFMVRNKP